MNIGDNIFSFLLAVLLHVLGLVLLGNWSGRSEAAASAPQLEPTSVEISLAEAEIEGPGGAQNDSTPAASPEVPTLALPEPAEPAPAEALSDKPDFTDALTPPPQPVVQAQPSPVTIAKPEAPAPAKPAPARPAPQAPAAAASTTPSSGQQATIQSLGSGGGGGDYGRVDAHPALERAIKPNYPIGARRRGEEGTVVLDVTVTAEGRAAQTALVSSSGFPELDRAAERAAAQARFKPGTRNGKPVESAARLTLVFRLLDF